MSIQLQRTRRQGQHKAATFIEDGNGICAYHDDSDAFFWCPFSRAFYRKHAAAGSYAFIFGVSDSLKTRWLYGSWSSQPYAGLLHSQKARQQIIWEKPSSSSRIGRLLHMSVIARFHGRCDLIEGGYRWYGAEARGTSGTFCLQTRCGGMQKNHRGKNIFRPRWKTAAVSSLVIQMTLSGKSPFAFILAGQVAEFTGRGCEHIKRSDIFDRRLCYSRRIAGRRKWFHCTCPFFRRYLPRRR